MVMISIVIPTYQESKYIAKTLVKLITQTTFSDMEIVIADYDPNKTKETLSTVQNIVNKYKQLSKKIIWVNVDKKGIGYARHQGILKSRGEYIINFDADAYFLQDYGIANLIAPFEADKINNNITTMMTHCNNHLDPDEHNPFPLTHTIYQFRNMLCDTNVLPLVCEEGITIPRYVYDTTSGFQDVKDTEGTLLALDVAIKYGIHTIKKVQVDIITSCRRIKQLQNRSILDVIDYHTAYRGDSKLDIT